VGIRYLPGCVECIGHKCPRHCKMDGRSAGVEPALATGRAALLDGCEVMALRGARGRVTHLEAERGGQRLRLRARCFVLAAGGLGSPRLLLRSADAIWPRGCANESGLVGRNLMFHLSERIAVWPARRLDFSGPAKTIALRDFYRRDGMRFGLFQSMGLGASYGSIVQYLNEKFDRSALRGLRPLREFTRLPALVAAGVFGDARIFVGILEDLPYPTNRVVLDPAHPERLGFDYTLAPELLHRRRVFRELIKAGLKGQRSFFLHIEPELNLAHPCGTLRFGRDPATSVLDASCRAHGLENLYVADSSFMPTSNGVNPSLTIAANALRVADRLIVEQRAAGSAVLVPGE
jgi:choline dehydrogenase-like flavoprotein